MSESDSRKRNLPSWMSSREQGNDDAEKSKQPRNKGKAAKEEVKSGSGFGELMEGVLFCLSGFVNPERGVLRSQMLEMGAEYQPDWNANCTLLVCAFSNTPKFKQVKTEGGTIISKDWISECYNERKLVDIEPFILNLGKPWRKQCISHEAIEDIKPPSSSKSSKQEEKSLHPKKTSGSPKMKVCVPPSKAKKWAVEDIKRTISWLQSQDEQPDPSEIKKIAAEGILTCLQDAIDALKQGQDIQKIVDQWACLPRVVEELAKFDQDKDGPTKECLCREAMACRQIYELEFLSLENEDIFVNSKRSNSQRGKKKENVSGNGPCYDSDATIEMTEEEVEEAYNIVCSL